jgi:hypothetical protein
MSDNKEVYPWENDVDYQLFMKLADTISKRKSMSNTTRSIIESNANMVYALKYNEHDIFERLLQNRFPNKEV